MKNIISFTLTLLFLSCKKENTTPIVLNYHCTNRVLKSGIHSYFIYDNNVRIRYGKYEIVYFDLDTKNRIIGKRYTEIPTTSALLDTLPFGHDACFLYKN